MSSPRVPEAKGSIKIKKDENENYAIKLNVRNLPTPERLHPPRKSYTVWLETRENRAKNIGNLKNSEGLFSKTRKGELETVTSSRPVRIFITAEDTKVPEYPGAEPMLSTSIFKIK